MRFNLLPKNDSLLPVFSQQASVLRDASRLLVAEAKSCDRSAPSLAAEIRELEHRGDELIRQLQTILQKTLVTNPQPEEARLLASRLDDVLDGIEESAYRISMYRLPGLPESALRLCEIIEACAAVLLQAVERLGRISDGTQFCAKIGELEHEADGVFRSGVADLFRCEDDPVLVLKLKEIYELLERTIDCCEDVADVVHAISVRNN